MKNVGTSMAGVESSVRTVEVRLVESCVLGFLMETLSDGRLVVYLPGVPGALVGTLHIMDADRVRILDLPVSKALDILSRLGVGLKDVQI